TGYPSRSEADLALCRQLVFWVFLHSEQDRGRRDDCDPDMIDRLFRHSRLFLGRAEHDLEPHAKWERRPDFRERTIRKGIEQETAACEAREAQRGVAGKELISVLASDVVTRPVEWLWERRIAVGKMMLLVGDPENGKSLLTLDIASRASTGGAWPDGGTAEMCRTILFSAEDAADDTIKPRLEALGANLTHVRIVQAVKDRDSERTFSIEKDLPLLEQIIATTRKVRLLVIDPLSAYWGSTKDSYRDTDIRAVLAPLMRLAERCGVAIIAIIHLTKDQQRRALNRVLGGIGFAAAARGGLAVGMDPG